MDFEKVLDDLQAASMAVPDIDGLRNIRAVLIQPDFFRQLEEIVARSHNQPDARHDLQSRLLAAKHAFREQKVSRAHDHAQSGTIVTGGGLAVGVGGILALLTPTPLFPLFPLLAIAAGAYSIWRGSNANRQLALEIAVIEDIDAAIDSHLSALRTRG